MRGFCYYDEFLNDPLRSAQHLAWCCDPSTELSQLTGVHYYISCYVSEFLTLNLPGKVPGESYCKTSSSLG